MDFQELYKFIKAYTGYELYDSSLNFSLGKDFGLYGDEAEEFIIEFSKKFNVDISSFQFNLYFNPEIDKISRSILNFIKPALKKDLTVEDLKSAIRAGRLV